MIRIYDETKKESDVLLKLMPRGNAVKLVVVNAQGKSLKSLLHISDEGKLVLHYYSEVEGIQTDNNGRIIIEQ